MVERLGFPAILEDNEQHYYQMLEAAITSIDEYSNVVITKGPRSLSVRISPSEPIYSQALLKEMLSLHNLLKLRLELSKSIRNTTNISFTLSIEH